MVTTNGIVGMTTLRVAPKAQTDRRAAGPGATSRILRYFIIENIVITTGGIVAGIVLAVLLNQLLVSQLELPKLPIAYLAIGMGVLWLLGIVAVYGPAWRAASIPPATATRSV
jgi:putative ABC transport system permease protein